MRGKTAIQRCIYLVIFSIMLFSFTACQPTPEVPVIIHKDALEQSIDSMPQQEEEFSAPESWQGEIVQDSTGNTVTVDADVVCPQFDSLDIMKVRPKNFTQEEVDAFIQYFVSDAALYNGEFVETKDSLDERIIELQQIKAMSPEEREAVCGYTVEELQQMLEELQTKYEAAPDEAPVAAVSSELTTDEDGFELLDVYAYNGGDDDVLIEVFNLAEESRSASFNIRLRDQSAGGKLLSYSGAPEEIAEEILKDFDLDGIRLERVSQAAASNEPGNNKTVTRLFYETTLKDIPIRSACSLIDEDQREYAASMLRPDSISFDVGDNGLTSFSWRQHSEIGETVKENVAILPFEDIMKKFEEYIFIQPIWTYGEHEKVTEPDKFVINSIELCMVAVPQKDAQGDYLLVPAWNFYGYKDYIIPEEFVDYSEEQLTAMGILEPNIKHSIMTISAVDGSLLHS